MNTITINKPGNSTVVLIMSPVGSYYEEDKYKGISHFLEHMCFKGTKKRTCKEISATIDNIGGDINAFTSYEITAYWAKVPNTYKNEAIDVIDDLVKNPIIPFNEAEKERKVIIQELKMYADNPKDAVCDIFSQALYDKKSGLYLSTIGTLNSLKEINAKKIKEYHKKYYSTNKLTKIIIGDIPNYEKFQMEAYPIKENFINKIKKDIIIEKKDLTQANVVIGNCVKPFVSTQEGEILNWLLSALYGDMSGRLFSSVREKHNLVYRIRFGINNYRNREMEWTVSLGLEKNKIKQARDLIVEELTRPISKKEMEIIIKKTIGTVEMFLDDNYHVANYIAEFVSRNMDYKFFLYDYKKEIKKCAPLINDYIKELHFENNVLAGVVGK